MSSLNDKGLLKTSIGASKITKNIGRNQKPAFANSKAKVCTDERSTSKQPISRNNECLTVRPKKNVISNEKSSKIDTQTIKRAVVTKAKKLLRELKPLSTQFGKNSIISNSIAKNENKKRNATNESEKLSKPTTIPSFNKPAKLKHLNYSTINTTTSNASNVNTSKTPSSYTSNQKRFFAQNNKVKEPVSTKNKDARPFTAIFNSFEISKEAMSFDEENNNSCDIFKAFYSQIINEKQKEAEAETNKARPTSKKPSIDSKIKSLKTNFGKIPSKEISDKETKTGKAIKVLRAQSKMIFKA